MSLSSPKLYDYRIEVGPLNVDITTNSKTSYIDFKVNQQIVY